MLVQHVLQGIVTQLGPARAWKCWLGRLALALSQPAAQRENRILAQRRATALAALALASHVGTGAEHDVLTAKTSEFRGPQPRLHSQHQKRPVAAPRPGCEFRRGKKRVDFEGR